MYSHEHLYISIKNQTMQNLESIYNNVVRRIMLTMQVQSKLYLQDTVSQLRQNLCYQYIDPT